MGLILNIDTATDSAQINFAKDGIVIHSLNNTEQKNHASFLQSAIKKMIGLTGISLKAIDAVAVTSGPGSYTGLRVGFASAKGLCYALKKPLITLNTLETLTASLQLQTENEHQPDELLYCPMIDARRMEVFTAIYNEPLKLILLPCAIVLEPHSFDEQLKNNTIIFFGNGAMKWQNICTHSNASFANVSSISATGIASLSHRFFLETKFTELAYSEPFYLKEFQDHSNKK